MGKTKTFQRRRISISRRHKSTERKGEIASIQRIIKKDASVTPFNPTAKLLDAKFIGAAIMECLIENDPDGIMEIIESHLEALNKSNFLREAGVPRSTMYKALKKKNPTIKTLAKIIYAAHHLENAK